MSSSIFGYVVAKLPPAEKEDQQIPTLQKEQTQTLHIITKERERALKGISKEAAEQPEIIKTVPSLAEIGNSVARIAQYLNQVRCCKGLADKCQNLLADTSCICHFGK